jgi:hypothetical protein
VPPDLADINPNFEGSNPSPATKHSKGLQRCGPFVFQACVIFICDLFAPSLFDSTARTDAAQLYGENSAPGFCLLRRQMRQRF